MKYKDSRSILLVNPGNWETLKRNVSGLADAARDTIKPPFNTAEIKIIKKYAYYDESMNLLKKRGLRPLTLRETLFSVINGPKILNKLKDNRFYIAGELPKTDGHYTIQPYLSLEEGKSDDIEKNIRCFSGNDQPLLFVHSDSQAHTFAAARFDLVTYNGSAYHAYMVVGVPQDMPIMA